MTLKLRPLPVLISLVVTSIVLFGGWFAYHSMAEKTPLTDMIRGMDGVKDVNLTLDSDAVHIQLSLDPKASIRDIYQLIETDGKSIIGDRSIDLTIANKSVPSLDEVWSNALFNVAQDMEQKQYGMIPDHLKQLEKQFPGLSATAEMDETNVYIRLTEGKNTKFVILPRTPERLGVWPNE